VDPHKQGQQDKTALNDVAGAACCVGVDSGVLLIEACTVCATNGTALGATGSEARIIIDQCHLKDSAFGVACVLGARVSCSRSLLSSLEQAAVIAVGNGSLCELESNSVSQHARGAYGMSVTEGAKAILEGNSFSRARDAGLSISGLSPHSPLPRPQTIPDPWITPDPWSVVPPGPLQDRVHPIPPSALPSPSASHAPPPLLFVSGRGSWARLTGNTFTANGEHGLLVADRAAAVVDSGLFECHVYGAVVLDQGFLPPEPPCSPMSRRPALLLRVVPAGADPAAMLNYYTL
jgi:hypothetical protein